MKIEELCGDICVFGWEVGTLEEGRKLGGDARKRLRLWSGAMLIMMVLGTLLVVLLVLVMNMMHMEKRRRVRVWELVDGRMW